jgi:membrane protease YdiL (CAAX protease family)
LAKIKITMRGVWQDLSPGIKMLLFVGIIAVCTCVFTLIGFIAAIPFFGVNLFTNPAAIDNLNDPNTLPLLKFIQIISQLGTMIIPAIIAAIFFSTRAGEYLHTNKKPAASSLALVTISIVCAGPLINFLLEVNNRMQLPSFLSGLEQWMKDYELKAQKLTEVFLTDTSPQQFTINILMIAVLPAIGEEFLFRGIFQKLFAQITKHKLLAVIITGALFSAIHLQFYGFIPRFLLGVYFGLLLVWSKNIWLPVLAHFVNNFLSLFLAALHAKNSLAFNPDTIGTTREDTVWVIASAAVVLICVWLVFKKEIKN